MKRIISVLLVFITFLLCGCGDTSDPVTTVPDETVTEETESAPTEDVDPRLSVEFSKKGGFIKEETEITLSLPENAPEGAYIAYTIDCSEPDGSSKKYTKPLTVGKEEITVLRAACFDQDGKYLGYIKTNTYIKAAPERYSCLIVSLVTENENLYGETGIIDHPKNTGKEWERPCHVEIFKSDGERIISQDAGLRIFGGSSRGLQQKSFRVIARKDGYYDEMKYNGKGSFEYPLFDGRTVIAGENKGKLLTKYDRFVLRNGGNDSLQATAADPTAMTLTRDAVANAFIAASSDKVAYQSSRFAVVYLNGDYYGILDMKEDINDDYVKNVYGLDKDFVTVIKSELDTTRHCDKHDNGGSCRFDDVWFYYEVDDGPETELEEYEKMCREAIAALGGDKETLDSAYKKLREQLDTDSFLEYAAICLYACNTDWPHNNLRVWRYTGEKIDGNPYSDGKWRYTARDMDFCFGRYKCLVLPEIYTQADMDNIKFTLENYKNGAYKYAGDYPDSLYLQGILALCLHNDDFRARFLSYSSTLCSQASVEKLKAIMEGYNEQIECEISHHIMRWKKTINEEYTPVTWEENTYYMSEWADQRPAYFKKYIKYINRYFK